MLKLLISGGKMLVALVVLYLSGAYRFPIGLFVIAGWGVWLWIVAPGRKERVFITLGLGLTALSWWVGTTLRQHLARKLEGSHFREEGDYWASLAVIAGNVGSGLVIVGILVLTYVDYQRSSKLKQAPEAANEVEAVQGEVWPPAPKQPQ